MHNDSPELFLLVCTERHQRTHFLSHCTFKLILESVFACNGHLISFYCFQEENLSAMNIDPWYSAYHHSHPPLVERLAAIDESEKKTD